MNNQPTVNINHRIATYEGPSLVGENEKYKLTFTFDEEWEGTTKTARFVWNRKFHDVPLDKHDQCEIPPFPSNAKLSIGVYSDTGLTSSAVEMPVCNSIKDGAIVPHPVVEVEVPPKWKLVKTINLIDGYYQYEKNEQSGPMEIGGDIYIEYDFTMFDIYASLENLAGITRIVLNLPCPAAPINEEPTDNFTVFTQGYLGYGESGMDLFAYTYSRMTSEVVEPLDFIVNIPEGYPPQMMGTAVCFIKMIRPDPEDPEYLEEGILPTEWNVEIYQLEAPLS